MHILYFTALLYLHRDYIPFIPFFDKSTAVYNAQGYGEGPYGLTVGYGVLAYGLGPYGGAL